MAKKTKQMRRLRESLIATLAVYDENTCVHEETHRGGSIWTICNGCGRKWADDQGGFVPYTDPKAIADARILIAETVD